MARLFHRRGTVRRPPTRQAASRVVAGLLLVIFAMTACGIPLPTKKTTLQSGELFPCAGSSCGCNSAERCWRSCCCQTLSQRLAWARRHKVQPPSFAIAAAVEAGLDIGGLTDTHLPTGRVASCCSARETPHEKSISIKVVVDHESSETNRSDSNVIGWRALACNGGSLNWLAAVPSLILPQLEVGMRSPAMAWLGQLSSDDQIVVFECPTVPPPERA